MSEAGKSDVRRPEPPVRVGMIGLGCAKNLVDAEIMLGGAAKENFDLTREPDEADVVITLRSSYKQKSPIIREAALQIADPQVRYFGTVGGNVANGDPGNDMPGLIIDQTGFAGNLYATNVLTLDSGRVASWGFAIDSIEVGIQNSALALVLVFNFFDCLGGMAIIVAWWGIWHIIAGLATAAFFSRRPLTGIQAP